MSWAYRMPAKEAATHPKLKQAFAEYERQTRVHVTRLERICRELGESPRACRALREPGYGTCQM